MLSPDYADDSEHNRYDKDNDNRRQHRSAGYLRRRLMLQQLRYMTSRFVTSMFPGLSIDIHFRISMCAVGAVFIGISSLMLVSMPQYPRMAWGAEDRCGA